jgi:hypothetical protein
MEDLNLSSRNQKVVVNDTNVNMLPINPKRKVFAVRNSASNGAVLTVHMGSNVAVALAGIVLTAGQSFTDSDSEGYKCWKGEVQAIMDRAGPGGLVSLFER